LDCITAAPFEGENHPNDDIRGGIGLAERLPLKLKKSSKMIKEAS
jgi:hypothetical protein